MFTREISTDITLTSISILAIFNSVIFIIFPNKIPKAISKDELTITCSRHISGIIFYTILLFLLYIFFQGFDAPEIPGERGSPKPIYDYAIVFFILGYYFTSNRKRLFLLDLMIILLAVKNFIYGGRILGIQFLTCYYLFRWCNKISIKSLLITIVPLFILMYIIGVVRGAILSNDISLSEILNLIVQNGFALDTAYAAYYTSEVYVYMSIVIQNHLDFLIAFLMALVIGYGSMPHLLLSNISHNYMANYNGGLYPFHFYFFGGIPLIIISALIFNPIFKAISKIGIVGNGGLSKCIGIYSVCTVFRWYLYSPFGFFRSIILMSICYTVLLYCSKKYKLAAI